MKFNKSCYVFLVVVLTMLILFMEQTVLYPQTTPTPPETQPEPDFPEYIVRPRENIDPFGMSSGKTSTLKSYREGAGTLGTKTERRSNSEVNKKITERKEQTKEYDQEKENENPAGTPKTKNQDVQYESVKKSSHKGKSKMYRWTDDQGNVHISNEIGAIPVKYREQAIEKSNWN